MKRTISLAAWCCGLVVAGLSAASPAWACREIGFPERLISRYDQVVVVSVIDSAFVGDSGFYEWKASGSSVATLKGRRLDGVVEFAGVWQSTGCYPPKPPPGKGELWVLYLKPLKGRTSFTHILPLSVAVRLDRRVARYVRGNPPDTAFSAPAAPQNLEQKLAYCYDETALPNRYTVDIRIEGCTAVIRSGRWSLEDLAKVLNLRGRAYSRSDDDRAIADYDEAIRLNPQLADAFYNRGAWHSNRGNEAPNSNLADYVRAIADYDEAIRLNPQIAKFFLDRGYVYSILGDDARAMVDYDEAIRLKPQFSYPYVNRSRARLLLHDLEGALADAQQAARLDPKEWRASSISAEAYLARQDYRKSILNYTRAIVLEPSQAWNFAHRGQAYEGLNDRARALADYRQAVSLQPEDAESRKGICRVLTATSPNSDETRMACSN